MLADYHVHTEYSDDSTYCMEHYHRYPFDFIILSIHQVNDQEFWTQDFQRGKTQKEYNEKYYEEILSVIQKHKNYSVLGHLDLIARYDKNGIYPFQT